MPTKIRYPYQWNLKIKHFYGNMSWHGQNQIWNYVEDFDKSPALPRRRFISLVLIVSFCFVGDNIFRPGVRRDRHLHPLSQATKSFPSKPEKSLLRKSRNPRKGEIWEIRVRGQSCKSCGRKSWQIRRRTEHGCRPLLQIEITSADPFYLTSWEIS